MAYRRRTSTRRRSSARSGYSRSRSYSPRRRRTTGRRTRSYGGGTRTVKIVVEQVAAGGIPTSPAQIGLKQAPAPKKAKF